MPSSRTPEGSPNRCPICGHKCRMEPSEVFHDAPCPSCGYLLRFSELDDTGKRVAYLWQYEFPLGEPFLAWVGGASNRLGSISPDQAQFLSGISTREEADRLKKLSRDAGSWAELLAIWE
jgi:hypothetical protein